MEFTKHSAKGCADLQIQFLKLFDYQLELLCLELWSLQKSKTCASSFDGKELCPPHDASPKMTVVNDTSETGNKLTRLRRSGEMYVLRGILDDVCSNACSILENATIKYFSKDAKDKAIWVYVSIAIVGVILTLLCLCCTVCGCRCCRQK